MPSTINVQIQFERDTSYGVYRDAIYLPIEDYWPLSENQVNALIDARVAEWIAVLESASEDEG